MTIVGIVPIVIGLFLSAFLGEQTKPPADVWQPFSFFVGKWQGTGTGKPGVSKVEREYRLTLNNKFLHVHKSRHTSHNQKTQRARSMKTGE